uniref:Uncharacterized protein n=1 Tax=Arundo donax TaxID=35708 RepID=A0A0A8ZZ18_ARUDO
MTNLQALEFLDLFANISP